MSRKAELAKNTAILTFGKICTQFVQFLLLPLYTALLVPEEFGIVDLFNTYITLLVPLFNWQFESGLFRFMLECRQDERRQKTVFSTVILSNIAQAGLYLLFFAVAQRYIHSEYKIFLAIDVVANIFLNTLLQMARGVGRNSVYAVGSFLSVTTTVVLNVLFIVGFKMGAMGMFLATALAKTITILYLFFAQKIWRYFRIGGFSKDEFKQIFRYSAPLVPNALSWWVINASDRTVISRALSVAANGIFSIASKFSSIYITVYNVFNMAWTESVSIHMNDTDRDVFLKDTINMMFRLFSTACLFLIAAMPFVFPLMVDAKYQAAYPQIPILMVAVLFQVVTGLYSVVYVALKKSKEIAKTSMFAAAINLAVDVLLIRQIGLYAASVSTLAAYASMAVYRYFDIKKYVNASLERKSIVQTVGVGAVVICSYYVNSTAVSAVVLAAATLYALASNRGFIKTVLTAVFGKLNARKQQEADSGSSGHLEAEGMNQGREYVPHTSMRYRNKDTDTESSGKRLPELYEKRENCCGCSACYAICPVKAITMEPDGEGFLYPVVDVGKCVRCYQCLAVCVFKEDQRNKGYLQ